MLALNADDSIVRLENLDLECGPIENIYFKDIYAEDCHTGVRLLSVDSPIRNITIDNMEVGHGRGASKKEAEQNAAYMMAQSVDDEACLRALDKIDKLQQKR